MRFRLLPKDSPVGWLPYSWLIYLSLYVVYPVLGHASPLEWAVYLAGLVVFLALYFRGFWLEGTELLPIMGGITALGAALIPWNPGANVFFVYAAAFAGDVGRPGVAFRWLCAIVLALGIETVALGLPPWSWIPGIVISLMVGGGNIHFAERRRTNARLRLAHDEVEQLAKVAERERIARDLHDLLGHTLSLIVLKSELASKLADRDPARATQEIRDVERISREALTEVRRAVQGYRQLTLDESLARVRQTLLAAGVAFESDAADVQLDAKVESVIALVVREAVTNIVRHAQASRCRLRLAQDGAIVRLEIHDDGVGSGGSPGSGLTGMRARVEELGGAFTHDGAGGTTLRIELPIRAPAAESRALRPDARAS